MVQLGWKAGPEQYGPVELLEYAVAAEKAGFSFTGMLVTTSIPGVRQGSVHSPGPRCRRRTHKQDTNRNRGDMPNRTVSSRYYCTGCCNGIVFRTRTNLILGSAQVKLSTSTR